MKGYKIFDANMRGRNGYQFQIGQTFVHTGEVQVDKSGFHFCEDMQDVLSFASYQGKNPIICVVAANGTITDRHINRRACSELTIVRQISISEVEKSITKEFLAYNCARNIGPSDYLRSLIKSSEMAYYWALSIGDKDHMIKLINDEQWASFWIRDIGNANQLQHFIKNPQTRVKLKLDPL